VRTDDGDWILGQGFAERHSRRAAYQWKEATMSAMTVDQADTILRVFSDPHKIEKLVCDINSPYLADARASLRRSIEAMESQVEHLRRIAEREGITETTREDHDSERWDGLS
jgi:hypothetical protein